MAIVTNSLKVLPSDKTVVFYSPIEGDDIMVRTGMIEDKCNFLHAILYSYSSDYTNMEDKEKKRFVKRLRASMAGVIDKNNWRKNPLLCHSLFCNILNGVLEDVYNYIENSSDEFNYPKEVEALSKLVLTKDRIKVYSLISKFIPLKVLLNITENIEENSRDLAIKPLKKVILDNISDLLLSHSTVSKAKKEKKEYLNKKLKVLYQTIFKIVEEVAFNKYIKELEKQSEIVDEFCMDYATEKFDRNIYFINKDRLPDTTFQKYNKYNRKCIVVLRLDENHYEILGKLLPDNYVQREFDFDDPIIKNIKSYSQKSTTIVQSPAKKELEEEIVEFDAENDNNSSLSGEEEDDNNYSGSDTE